MHSLENRRNTLVYDNNKIYDQFNMVVDLDKQKKSTMSKSGMILLNKEDHEVINF